MTLSLKQIAAEYSQANLPVSWRPEDAVKYFGWLTAAGDDDLKKRHERIWEIIRGQQGSSELSGWQQIELSPLSRFLFGADKVSKCINQILMAQPAPLPLAREYRLDQVTFFQPRLKGIRSQFEGHWKILFQLFEKGDQPNSHTFNNTLDFIRFCRFLHRTLAYGDISLFRLIEQFALQDGRFGTIDQQWVWCFPFMPRCKGKKGNSEQPHVLQINTEDVPYGLKRYYLDQLKLSVESCYEFPLPDTFWNHCELILAKSGIACLTFVHFFKRLKEESQLQRGESLQSFRKRWWNVCCPLVERLTQVPEDLLRPFLECGLVYFYVVYGCGVQDAALKQLLFCALDEAESRDLIKFVKNFEGSPQKKLPCDGALPDSRLLVALVFLSEFKESFSMGQTWKLLNWLVLFDNPLAIDAFMKEIQPHGYRYSLSSLECLVRLSSSFPGQVVPLDKIAESIIAAAQLPWRKMGDPTGRLNSWVKLFHNKDPKTTHEKIKAFVPWCIPQWDEKEFVEVLPFVCTLDDFPRCQAIVEGMSQELGLKTGLLSIWKLPFPKASWEELQKSIEFTLVKRYHQAVPNQPACHYFQLLFSLFKLNMKEAYLVGNELLGRCVRLLELPARMSVDFYLPDENREQTFLQKNSRENLVQGFSSDPPVIERLPAARHCLEALEKRHGRLDVTRQMQCLEFLVCHANPGAFLTFLIELEIHECTLKIDDLFVILKTCDRLKTPFQKKVFFSLLDGIRRLIFTKSLENGPLIVELIELQEVCQGFNENGPFVECSQEEFIKALKQNVEQTSLLTRFPAVRSLFERLKRPLTVHEGYKIDAIEVPPNLICPLEWSPFQQALQPFIAHGFSNAQLATFLITFLSGEGDALKERFRRVSKVQEFLKGILSADVLFELLMENEFSQKTFDTEFQELETLRTTIQRFYGGHLFLPTDASKAIEEKIQTVLRHYHDPDEEPERAQRMTPLCDLFLFPFYPPNAQGWSNYYPKLEGDRLIPSVRPESAEMFDTKKKSALGTLTFSGMGLRGWETTMHVVNLATCETRTVRGELFFQSPQGNTDDQHKQYTYDQLMASEPIRKLASEMSTQLMTEDQQQRVSSREGLQAQEELNLILPFFSQLNISNPKDEATIATFTAVRDAKLRCRRALQLLFSLSWPRYSSLLEEAQKGNVYVLSDGTLSLVPEENQPQFSLKGTIGGDFSKLLMERHRLLKELTLLVGRMGEIASREWTYQKNAIYTGGGWCLEVVFGGKPHFTLRRSLPGESGEIDRPLLCYYLGLIGERIRAFESQGWGGPRKDAPLVSFPLGACVTEMAFCMAPLEATVQLWQREMHLTCRFLTDVGAQLNEVVIRCGDFSKTVKYRGDVDRPNFPLFLSWQALMLLSEIHRGCG